MKKVLVIGLVMLAGLGLSGCLPTGTSDTGSEEVEVVEKPSDKETEGWQIYRHSGPDYRLKHMESWIPKLTPNPTMGDLEFLNLSTVAEDFTPTDCSFGVKTWDSPMTADMELPRQRATETSEVEIDGVKAQKFVYAPNEQYMAHDHFLEKDGYSYNISFGLKNDKPQEECLDLLGKMLGTFQFKND
ncbi:hypothetical protein ACFL18_02100 [Patescibacteria group bacterium]